MDKSHALTLPYIPFAQPDLDEAELNEVAECLASGWITTGPKVKQFEALLAEYLGARHAVAVNSATAAMHLSLEAVDTQPGDLVFVPAYTFAATAEIVHYFGAIPVLVDSDPDDLNLSPAALARTLELADRGELILGDDRYKVSASACQRALIPVHLGGQAARMDAIYSLAREYDLSVIEDAAHAMPSRYKGRLIGATPANWPANDQASSEAALPAHTTCFSFYATKTLAMGEGGLITTDDDALAERCRIMSLHGISRDAWKRYTSEGSWYYEVAAPGFKYNLTDLAAALGIAQFHKLERMWQRRCEIAQAYSTAFAELAEYVQIPVARQDVQRAWHLYTLRLNVQLAGDDQGRQAALGITRSEFILALRTRGIGTSVHFIPLHLHRYYRDEYGYQPMDFPIAYREYQRAVSLPIYSKMTDADVERVIETVSEVVLAHRT